jgi:hypothetical protein
MKVPARKRTRVFDPKAFLSSMNGGRTIAAYRRNRTVYRQGDPADSVFYIQTGKAKVTATRSRVSAFMNKFRRLGLIDYNGQIEVHRSPAERGPARKAGNQNLSGWLKVINSAAAIEAAKSEHPS